MKKPIIELVRAVEESLLAVPNIHAFGPVIEAVLRASEATEHIRTRMDNYSQLTKEDKSPVTRTFHLAALPPL